MVIVACLVWKVPLSALASFTGENAFDPVKDTRWLLIYLAAVGLGPIGLYLNNKNTKLKSIEILNQSFAKSVELLGHESVAVRQGAIFSLQKLLETNPELQKTIIRILTAFVRTQSNISESSGEGEKPESEKENSAKSDIEAALLVIRERNKRNEEKPKRGQFLFDMSGAKLKNVDLVATDFSYFNLSDCDFRGCSLNRVKFDSALLVSAKFRDETDLTGASFFGTDITGTNKENICDLSGTIGLTSEQLLLAKGNRFTRIPADFLLADKEKLCKKWKEEEKHCPECDWEIDDGSLKESTSPT